MTPAAPHEALLVECYAGHRGEQTPRSFHLDGRRVAVATVIAAWLEPDCRCFRVAGEDGAVYLLRNETVDGIWRLGE